MAYDDDETLRRNRNRSWWQQRTHMERRIVIALGLAVIVIIALIIALALVGKSKKGTDATGICVTQSCIENTATLMQSMDQSLDPCNDFYQFACGGFLKETQIPDDKIKMNKFVELSTKLSQQLRIVLEEPSQVNETKPFTFLKNIYNACMNVTDIEELGLAPVNALLRNIGGWPILEARKWNEEAFTWQKSVRDFRTHGLSTDFFIGFGQMNDPNNSTLRILAIDQPQLDVGRENLVNGLEDALVKAYYDYMIKLAEAFGVGKAFAEFEVKNMLQFKIQLANITIPEDQRRDATAMTNIMTIAELQQRYPEVQWLDYINSIIATPNITITSEEMINVRSPQYISDLIILLSQTSKRAQANFAIFQAIRSLVAYLPKTVRDLEMEFLGVQYGMSKDLPKWEECVAVASNALNVATAALYVRRYFSDSTRSLILEIIGDIQHEFIKILEKVTWMDDKTKKIAIEKAKVITKHVGHPIELLDNEKLEAYYSRLPVDANNYLNLMLSVNLFTLDKEHGSYRDPLNITDWQSHSKSADINAYYSYNENSIQIPAAILQGVTFDKDRPQYLNYGAIGYFIGHEITHGFDDEGRQYDKSGNLVSWWANSTNEAYLEKAKCIINQYEQYKVPEIDMNLNGVNTQGENIADNGGIKEAYLAYNTWIERNGAEPTLPGLKYTPKQLFWISAASLYCSKDRLEMIQQTVMYDKHSPERYRVNVPMGNTDYFSKDFNCPEGSKMNIKDKCHVW